MRSQLRKAKALI